MSEDKNFRNKDLALPDEITFSDLFKIIWKNRLTVFLISSIAFIAVFLYALNLPTYYQATGNYHSESANTGTTLNTPLSGLGLGGLTIGGNSNTKLDLAFNIIHSRKFLKDFIIKRELASKLSLEMTKEEISSLSPQDHDLFILGLARELASSINWLRVRSDPAFTFWVTNPSPIMAKQLVDWIIEDINKVMMEADVDEAKKSIDYLYLQASKTSIADLRELFYSMIESHTTTIMLSEVKKEYVIKTIDPPVVPLGPSSTNKLKVLTWGSIGSLLLSFLLVYLFYFLGYELRFKKPYIRRID